MLADPALVAAELRRVDRRQVRQAAPRAPAPRHALATSQSWPWMRSKSKRSHSARAGLAHVRVHVVDPADERLEVVLRERRLGDAVDDHAGAVLLARVLARAAREHVDLDVLADQALGELAHVAARGRPRRSAGTPRRRSGRARAPTLSRLGWASVIDEPPGGHRVEAGDRRPCPRSRRGSGRRRGPRRRGRRRRSPRARRRARRRRRRPPGGGRAGRACPGSACSFGGGPCCSARWRGAEVDGPAVVGVDERAVLDLVAAVDVRDAGDGELERELAERGAAAVGAGALGDRVELDAERLVGEQLARPRAARTPRSPCPGRPSWCAAWPRAAPSRGSRRGARAARSGGRRSASAGRGSRRSGRAPPGRSGARARPSPSRRSGPVSAPMRARTSAERLVSCVVETSRPRGGALGVGRVERGDVDAEAARVAADLVEALQAQVAVEGGVLDALGGDGRRGLLEAGDELVDAALSSRQDRGSVLGQRRPAPSRSASSTGAAVGST